MVIIINIITMIILIIDQQLITEEALSTSHYPHLKEILITKLLSKHIKA